MKRLLVALPLVLAALGCSTERRDDPIPTYRDDVQLLLGARCAQCHAGLAPAGGLRLDTYLGAVGCTVSGEPVTSQVDPPLLRALARPDHAGLLQPNEQATLARWIAAGAPSSPGGVHECSFADPRSPSSHGRLLRARGYRPMRDGNDVDACGRCHDGAPSRPAGVLFGAPDAPACTTCHSDPGGVLACSTCHGAPGRPYPPRDPCFFPGEDGGAHAAHAGASASRAEGLPCTTCHPTPVPGQLDGTHTNGSVEVWLDPVKAGASPRWDAATKRCAGTCHDRGGARPEPAWTERAMTCNDCHASPPPAHYAGACSSCHGEADAVGAALAAPVLHLNGRVDLGDGSGQCGACHGQGASPWPTTGAHAAHAAPAGARAVACETCHPVPLPGEAHPVGCGAPLVRLLGLARKGGSPASFDPQTKACAGTYCHAGRGATAPAPTWAEGASERARVRRLPRAAAARAAHRQRRVRQRGLPRRQHDGEPARADARGQGGACRRRDRP